MRYDTSRTIKVSVPLDDLDVAADGDDPEVIVIEDLPTDDELTAPPARSLGFR